MVEEEALRGPCDLMDDNNSTPRHLSVAHRRLFSSSAYSRPPLLSIPACMMVAISMYMRACSSIVLGSTDESTAPLSFLH
jgi:hypothetical protein